MTGEKSIRLALLICLTLALVMYHSIEVVMTRIGVVDFRDLIKIGQIAVSGVLFAWLLYWPPFVKLILRDKFIAGTYSGKSDHHAAPLDKKMPLSVECTVVQNLFGAILVGRSMSGDELISTWTGCLYRVIENEFSFAIELNWKKPEVGVIRLNIIDGNANGIYYGADPGYKYPFVLSMTRIKA